MVEELSRRRPHLLWSEEDAGNRTALLVDHAGPSNPAPAPSHHAVDDAEIMSWLLPCPLALNHCFNDVTAGDGFHGGKLHPASLTINNAREDVAVLADCDRTVKLNKEAAEDDGMKKRNKKKKKKKRVSGEAGINRDGRMMMVNSSSSRDCLMVNSKDLLPPLDSGFAPITRQSHNQQVPNLDIIAALLPPPHGGGDELCVIAESSSSALSGRGSSSCMEGWGNIDAHRIIHANGQSLNQSLIKGGNPKVVDNLDCMAQFNAVSNPSRCSSSTTQKSVKVVDGSSQRKISNDDESEGQSENVEEEGVDMERKKPSSEFSSAKRTRAAEVHNESERRRRDKINEKMRALQQIIPNSNKTDKASMLDEAIEYLKYLQAQVQYLSMNLGPLMMPMGMQYQQNLGLGMGIMDVGLGALNSMHYPQQHYLPGYHPILPLSNAAEGLEHLQPQIDCNGNGNVMNSYSYLIPRPHHLQWMQQARHPPSVQLNMQQHHMQPPMQQQLLPLPSLQQAKAQMNQSLGESTR